MISDKGEKWFFSGLLFLLWEKHNWVSVCIWRAGVAFGGGLNYRGHPIAELVVRFSDEERGGGKNLINDFLLISADDAKHIEQNRTFAMLLQLRKWILARKSYSNTSISSFPRVLIELISFMKNPSRMKNIFFQPFLIR